MKGDARQIAFNIFFESGFETVELVLETMRFELKVGSGSGIYAVRFGETLEELIEALLVRVDGVEERASAALEVVQKVDFCIGLEQV